MKNKEDIRKLLIFTEADDEDLDTNDSNNTSTDDSNDTSDSNNENDNTEETDNNDTETDSSEDDGTDNSSDETSTDDNTEGDSSDSDSSDTESSEDGTDTNNEENSEEKIIENKKRLTLYKNYTSLANSVNRLLSKMSECENNSEDYIGITNFIEEKCNKLLNNINMVIEGIETIQIELIKTIFIDAKAELNCLIDMYEKLINCNKDKK